MLHLRSSHPTWHVKQTMLEISLNLLHCVGSAFAMTVSAYVRFCCDSHWRPPAPHLCVSVTMYLLPCCHAHCAWVLTSVLPADRSQLRLPCMYLFFVLLPKGNPNNQSSNIFFEKLQHVQEVEIPKFETHEKLTNPKHQKADQFCEPPSSILFRSI